MARTKAVKEGANEIKEEIKKEENKTKVTEVTGKKAETREEVKSEVKPAEKATTKSGEEAAEEKSRETKEEVAKPKKTEKTEEKKTLEKVYTIPLSEVYNQPWSKRARKATRMVREFLQKHTKKEVKIAGDVNNAIWSRGMKHPPRKIRVNVEIGENVATARLLK